MEVNGVVVMALIFGGLAILLSTISRYLIPPELPSSFMRRLFNAIRVIDVRQNKPEVRVMLFQYTGVIWLLLGIMYEILSRSFDIQGVTEHFFEFLVLVVPGALLILIMSILRKVFWR